MKIIWRDLRNQAEPAPAPIPVPTVMVHGVALGPQAGAIVSVSRGDGVPTVTDLRRYPPALAGIGGDVRALLASDPTCMVIVDAGLHGRDLWAYLDLHLSRRRLSLLEIAKAEMRRYEIAGRLRSAYESRSFTVKRGLAEEGALRKAISEATREDAADRAEIVALSLAVVDRRPPVPRIG